MTRSKSAAGTFVNPQRSCGTGRPGAHSCLRHAHVATNCSGFLAGAHVSSAGGPMGWS